MRTLVSSPVKWNNKEDFKSFQGWNRIPFTKNLVESTWVAQSVQRLTLHLSSGLDLSVVSSSPELGSMLGMEST